jgi:hypothetical protein
MLGAQACAHGMLCAFTIIPAAGLFLSAYGPARLPYVYMLVAATGVVTAPFFGRALGRWAVATVARPVLLGLVALHLGCWAVLAGWDTAWPSVILEVLFPLSLQVGFVFLGTQAGRLLTMREMKAWFSIIASGFSVGFLLGSLVAPLVIDSLGGTENILGLTALSALAMLVLVSRTHHRYALSLGPPSPARRTAITAPAPPSGAPVRVLIILLFGYQVLSALGTQFADFLLYDRAAARYSTSQELARFTAHFNVGLNLFELVFLFVLAGPLLARFGLRLGLFANPVVLTAAVIGATLAGVGLGTGSLALFMVVGAARIGDIALTNSTTRTATNTAYLALPVAIRPSVQARAEGLGVPGAIGLSGAILLLVVEVGNGGVQAVIGVTIAICAMWLVVTFALYRRYRLQLRENFSHRVLTPHLIPYGDSVTDGMIDLLLHDDLDDDAGGRIAASHDPEVLADRLGGFLDDPDADPRTGAQLVRRARSDHPALVDALLHVADHRSRHLRGLALHRLAVLMSAEDPRRDALARRAIERAASDAAEIVHALSRLPGSDVVAPLRHALLDEGQLVRDHVLYALALVIDAPTMDRARQWLMGDERQRAVAMETIEVNAPGAHRAAVMAIIDLDHDLSAAERGLRATREAWPATADVLADLLHDPRGVWSEPWLVACAQHALGVRHE